MMGMFDQLRIKQPMPDGYQSDDWYQTKSIECLLLDFEVDESGQLWEVGLFGHPTPYGTRQIFYTGEIHFYQDRRYYDALFDMGKLVVIRVSDRDR